MAVLVIDEKTQSAIDAALEKARSHPMTLDEVKQIAAPPETANLKLEHRPPDFDRTTRSVNVMIPHGYRAAVTFEEQPVGLCIHLSISVERAGKMPSIEAAGMIAEAFGLKLPLEQNSKFWLEEFEPGQSAINIVQIAPQ